MEVAVSLLILISTYLIAVIIRWAVNRHRRLQVFKKYGIPGPRPSFLSGNMSQLKASSTPNEVITAWIKEYGNVFGYFVGEIPYVIINDLDMLKQVMIKDFPIFTNRADMHLDVHPLNKTVLALNDKRWKEVRSVLTPTFSSGKIKLMTYIVDKKVDVMLDVITKKAEKGEMFDIYENVQALTLDVIADCALAMKTHCQENTKDIFLIAVRDFFRFSHNRAVDCAIMFPFVATIMAFITNYMTSGQMTSLIVSNVEKAIAARRKNPEIKSVDFLQLLVDHGKNDSREASTKLTDDEIIANAYVFVLAGYETTATALAFTFYLLVKHPEIQEKLYQEVVEVDEANYANIQGLQYLDQVFGESMRMYPPVTGFVARKCAEDHQIGSYTIPKGAIVQAPVWDIHHNPDFWPDPWKFDPERFSTENKISIKNMSYIPFGVGPRNCIGARFAQLEAKLTLFKLLKKFRFEACEKTDDPLPLICPTVIINPANGVYVKAVLRNAK
ncbi:cytochrome P450 3A31-like isoform X1 [Stegodyphus dumicola]|uniref:cytochrome P450 3A31-like isoform X1 n=2 Tax=Stegodyphus dumicola TaxID=202533 RepID=UPI0015A8A050|nr:cytochrome P450 3A31-like isoform X1 [Stegodyphus dumicola]XP_035228708.1 cytochrome P450 3A31-like isoform X1 [Stegodyphus dumicola]XP_035228709.1 cytochrome P450 3A31-like isoform X1 [Stegodyphus dumicola]